VVNHSQDIVQADYHAVRRDHDENESQEHAKEVLRDARKNLGTGGDEEEDGGQWRMISRNI